MSTLKLGEYACKYCKATFQGSECTSWKYCPKCLDIQCSERTDGLSWKLSDEMLAVYSSIRESLKESPGTRRLLQSKDEIMWIIIQALVELQTKFTQKQLVADAEERGAKRARSA